MSGSSDAGNCAPVRHVAPPPSRKHVRSLHPAPVAAGPSSDDEEEEREGEHQEEEQEAAGARSGSSDAGWQSDGAGEEEREGDAGAHRYQEQQQQQDDDAEGEQQGSESSVVCVTGDYAMQNVILQMGLRLCAPDGMRITRTRRWALRCTACSQVSKVRCARVLSDTIEGKDVVRGAPARGSTCALAVG